MFELKQYIQYLKILALIGGLKIIDEDYLMNELIPKSTSFSEHLSAGVVPIECVSPKIIKQNYRFFGFLKSRLKTYHHFDKTYLLLIS